MATISGNKETLYYLIIGDPEDHKIRDLQVANPVKLQAFLSLHKPGTHVRVDLTVVKDYHSDKQRGFLHGGVFKQLAEHLGDLDPQVLKSNLKKKFLKIRFKQDLDGNDIIDKDTGLAIPVENEFFDLTVEDIIRYYPYWKNGFDDELVYPTSRLSKEKYALLITKLIAFIEEQFNLVIEARSI